MRCKAPTIAPTGCLSCSAIGIPGTPCASCVMRAHNAAVRLADQAMRFGSGTVTAKVRMCAAEDARAAWVGAELLLDGLGVLLVCVGFELPDVPDVARAARR